MFGRTNIRPVKNGLKAVLRSFPVKPWVRPKYRCVFFVQGKARKVLVAEQTQKSSVRRIRKSKKGTDSRTDTRKCSVRRISNFLVRSRDARRIERGSDSCGVGRTAYAGTNRGHAQNANNRAS